MTATPTAPLSPTAEMPGDPLSVPGGITRLMRIEAAQLSADIHGRELENNSEPVGSTKHYGHIIWPRVESKSVYDMAYSDDGFGMPPAELEALGNVLDEARTTGKSNDLFVGNFNWGMRLTCQAHAHVVFVVSTTVDENGDSRTYLVILTSNGDLTIKKFRYDPGTGETTVRAIYGPHFQAVFADIIEEHGFDPVAFHDDYLKNTLKSKHGTTVMLVNSVSHGHTYFGSHGYNRPHTRGNEGNLNKRLWTTPEGMKIGYTEFHNSDPATWPKTAAEVREGGKADAKVASGQIVRTIKGAKNFIERPQNGGYVGGDGEEIEINSGPLKGGKIWWALRSAPNPTGQLAPFNDRGYIAILHSNELFHHLPSNQEWHEYRRWGITEKSVRENLFIIIEAPTRRSKDGSGVSMDTKRSGLKWAKDGKSGEITEVFAAAAEHFRASMPDKVHEALKVARGDYDPEEVKDDTEARVRFLERYKNRMRRARLRRTPKGSERVLPTDIGGDPRTGVSPSPVNTPNLPHPPGQGGMGGDVNYGPEGGDAPGEHFLAAGDLPEFSTRKTEWDEDWIIATYDMEPPAGDPRRIYLNASHPFVISYVDYLIDKREAEGWDEAEKAIRTLAHESYREILWGCVAQSHDLRGLGRTEDEVKENHLSDTALTTACLGYAHLDAIVGPRMGPLSAKLGPRPTTA